MRASKKVRDVPNPPRQLRGLNVRERTMVVPVGPMREVERRVVAAALVLCDGNKTKAAAMVGVSRRGIYYKMGPLTVLDPTTEAITVSVGPLSDVEQCVFVAALTLCDGNKSDASRRLEVSRRTVYNKQVEHHIAVDRQVVTSVYVRRGDLVAQQDTLVSLPDGVLLLTSEARHVGVECVLSSLDAEVVS